MSRPTLTHFATFRLGDAFWSRSPTERADLLRGWISSLEEAAPRVELYQVYPTRADLDLLVWSARPVDGPEALGEHFNRLGGAIHKHRPAIRPELTLWGTTRPSPYARRGSDRAIDAIEGERAPYLVVYPFVKTAAWYLLESDERQRMMNEHIRVGRQFEQVRQLLLYSFGLQDQDFVVVYETPDLIHFSELVYELRSTEARRFTERDTPIVTALHRSSEEILDLLS